MQYLQILSLTALLTLFAGCGNTDSNTPAKPGTTPMGSSSSTPKPATAHQQVSDIDIVVITNRGQIEATLFARKTPMTVANFLNLAQRGYYAGLTFHRVVPNFMIQGGDPEGTGRGGPGYQFPDEIHPRLSHSGAGIFSMANSGPNTNGSQFFITHTATTWLNGRHTVFGRVTKGQDVVNAIRQGDIIQKIEILEPTDALFRQEAGLIANWNRTLNAAE